jgi:hypothetical protein
MLSSIHKNVLRLIAQDMVYSDRSGGSMSYRRNEKMVRELAHGGYCLAASDGCCRVDYIITPKGEAVLGGGKGKSWQE